VEREFCYKRYGDECRNCFVMVDPSLKGRAEKSKSGKLSRSFSLFTMRAFTSPMKKEKLLSIDSVLQSVIVSFMLSVCCFS
jgi:hypothetical protein